MGSPESLVDFPSKTSRGLSHTCRLVLLSWLFAHTLLCLGGYAPQDGVVADLVEFVFLFCFAPCPAGSSAQVLRIKGFSEVVSQSQTSESRWS